MEQQQIQHRLLTTLRESDSLVCHLATENAPYLKRGGLGDILESLPHYLGQHQLQNVVIIPFYSEIGESYHPELVYADTVSFHGVPYQYQIYCIESQGVFNLFVQLEEAFTFDRLYQDGYAAYQAEVNLNHFVIGKVVVHFLEQFVSRCVLFTHDWHVGAVYPYLKHSAVTCHTFHVIHNYHHQGEIFEDILDYLEEEIRDGVAELFARYGCCTLSAIAIEGTDQILTVSPQYALELQEQRAPHPFLQALEGRSIIGILNGMHSHIWNPERDPYLKRTYSQWDPEGKRENKQHLIETYGLNISAEDPITVMVSRLGLQKGIDLLLDLGLGRSFDPALRMQQLLNLGGAIIVCGTPEGGKIGTVDRQFRRLAEQFPGRFIYINRYTEQTAHDLLAGSDLLLHPSRFEPCGLTQMHAMRYGTLPIVTAVGGLKDSVVCALNDPEHGFGFHMKRHSFDELHRVLAEALQHYQDQPLWQEFVIRAMEQQNGWDVRIEPYLKLVGEALATLNPADVVKLK